MTEGVEIARADQQASGNGEARSLDDAVAAASAAKAAGTEALKSADLPLALERYEEAVRLCDAALDVAPQAKLLRNNETVRYGDNRFAIIDTAYPQFEDYVLMDLGTRSLVQHKVGRHDFDMVSRRFLRKELRSVPADLFELRVGCLQNIALVALKLAKGSQRDSDFKEAVARADAALAMDSRSAKANMRKGQALVELRDWANASKVLIVAAQETKCKDMEVQRLLLQCMEAKGKGKGKAQGKGKAPRFAAGYSSCLKCKDPTCADDACRVPGAADEGPASDSSDDEFLKTVQESDWQPVDPLDEDLLASRAFEPPPLAKPSLEDLADPVPEVDAAAMARERAACARDRDRARRGGVAAGPASPRSGGPEASASEAAGDARSQAASVKAQHPFLLVAGALLASASVLAAMGCFLTWSAPVGASEVEL